MTRLTEEWVHAAAPVAIMAALGEGYFVGGCVRNALIGAPMADIDIATPLNPDEAITRLEAAGIRTVPTGLKHGTITAVIDHHAIEVTSFRIDIETDGRRAIVHFTTDIAEDAARRDFTINALYAAADGQVIDPLGGLPDLEARRVRFIGDPHDRIREDFLRILRFFRFHAWYGRGGIDAEGLAACAELADGLDGLARERVGWEFRKLLGAPDPAPAVAAMAASGILARCLPGTDPALLAPLVHVEQSAGADADWLTRLVVLGGSGIREALRLSRIEDAALMRTREALAEPRLPVAAYRFGPEATLRARLIRAASTDGRLDPGDLGRIHAGAAAIFPLAAADLMARGFVPGPGLGEALDQAETRWIDSGFSLDKPELLEQVANN